MTAIDRSNLSCRTILFLIALLGIPTGSRSAGLEDSAKELARKIAAALPAREIVSVEIGNNSSLTPEEVSAVEQALKSDLQSQGFRAPGAGAVVVNVRVTLSENVKDFLWVAEFSRDNTSQIVLLAVPRFSEDRVDSSSMPATLRSEKFWEGQQRILDATISNSQNGDPLLLLLTPDRLLIRKVGSDFVATIQIPPAKLVARDPKGMLTVEGNRLLANSVQQYCDIDLDARTAIDCYAGEGPPPRRDFANLELLAAPGPEHVQRGSQTTAIQSDCMGGILYIAAGTGDYTEPDAIQLFESKIVRGVIVERSLSDVLPFAGPVMALQYGGATPRAIVHNLQTGNYEAYRISISCRN